MLKGHWEIKAKFCGRLIYHMMFVKQYNQRPAAEPSVSQNVTCQWKMTSWQASTVVADKHS